MKKLEGIQAKSFHNLPSGSEQSHVIHSYSVIEKTQSYMTFDSFQELIARCKKAYAEHLLDEAFRLMKECKQFEADAKDEKVSQIVNQEKELFDTIKSEYHNMSMLLQEMENKKGWTSDKIGSSATFHYKRTPETEFLCMKVEAVVDIPIQIAIAMIYEVNLCTSWMPFVKRSTELKKVQRNSLIYSIQFELPYPLNNREALLYGMVWNRLEENGSILILSRSLQHDPEFLKKHKIDKVEKNDSVSVDFHFGGFEITPLGPDKCKIAGLSRVNPKLKLLPDSMINFLFKKGIQLGMGKLLKKAKNYHGSAWEREAYGENKKEFYDWIRQILKDHDQGYKRDIHPRL